MSFAAVIWDCDGCLIDSEHIACGLSARLFTEAGYAISTQDFVHRFAGQSKNHIFQTIQNECGVDYRAHMQGLDKKKLQRDAFQQELKAIDGIYETLDAITLPTAIASGSEWDRLEFTLKLTDLYDRFMPHIYPASLVAKGKPAPDIFLHAAERLGVNAADCLVIEDSVNGVRAGKAAGMTVYGFTGGSHVPDKGACADQLLALGADQVFHRMAELQGLMAARAGQSGLKPLQPLALTTI